MDNTLPYTVLVVADSNFKHACDDPTAYLERLKTVLADRGKKNLHLMTIGSKYGLLDVDAGLDHFSIEDKNKTSFVQTVELIAGRVDELLVVSIVANDPFLDGLVDSLGKTKTVTRYSYRRKA